MLCEDVAKYFISILHSNARILNNVGMKADGPYSGSSRQVQTLKPEHARQTYSSTQQLASSIWWCSLCLFSTSAVVQVFAKPAGSFGL